MSGSLTLDWLLRQRALKLETVANFGGTFSVIHPCELEDPREFVGEDTVVLLTGIAFRDRPEALADYIHRVAEVGVVGVGLGVGIAFDTLPTEMKKAAEAEKITLFSIPHEIPFVSILASVHAELGRHREREWVHLAEAQEALNTAAVGGVEELVKQGQSVLKAHVGIVEREGRVTAQALNPELETVDFSRLAAAVRGGSAGRVGSMWVLSHRLSSTNEGFFVASPEPFSANQRALVKHCAGLSDLILKRPRNLRALNNELNSLAMAIQLGRDTDLALLQKVFRVVGDAQGRVRPVLVKSESPRGHARLLRVVDTRLEEVSRQLFALEIDPTTSILLFRGSRSLHNIQELFRGVRGMSRIVAGAPLEWEELDWTLVSGMERSAFGLQPGALVGPDARGLEWIAAQELKPVIAARVRETWDRLKRYDAENGTELTQFLHAYLRAGGQVKQTAETLETHRHTVRRRLSAVESILEVDLKDPLLAAELMVLGVAAGS